MDIDIAPYIKELLYKHNNLVIPGFGNFVLSYASTTIDHVQGILNPPSKKIAFDTNLLTNDGKLIEYLKEKHQLGSEDATAIINTFVSKLKMQLGKREMVNIPEVGRLYKDFEDNIQFIPDVTNFSKESFGLPTINFYPIIRDNTTKAKKATASATVSSTNAPIKAPQSDNNIAKTATKTIKQAEPVKKTITKPAKKGFWDTYFWIPGEAEEAEEYIDTESITVNPNQRECIVSIGVFGQKANATNMIQQVYDKGYDAYRDNYIKNGRELTKVGVQFAYETQEEYQRKVNKIKQDFPNAVVIKK